MMQADSCCLHSSKSHLLGSVLDSSELFDTPRICSTFDGRSGEESWKRKIRQGKKEKRTYLHKVQRSLCAPLSYGWFIFISIIRGVSAIDSFAVGVVCCFRKLRELKLGVVGGLRRASRVGY